MKKIAVFFTQPNLYDYPFNDYKETAGMQFSRAYEELAQEITERGGEFWVARDEETYLGQQKFKKGWCWNGAEFAKRGAFQADVIYDKHDDSMLEWSRFRQEPGNQILNANELMEICNNKFRTYEKFPEFCPQTFLAKNAAELKQVLTELKTERKVAKPLKGFGGVGILIGNAAEISAQADNYPYIVQEFLDTKAGIPGIIEGVHDLRLFRINAETVFSYVRTPPPNSFTANLTQGGQALVVPFAKIPAELSKIVEKIDSNFKHLIRAYSIDFSLTKTGFKLIELNSQPALVSRRFLPEFAEVQAKLAEVLLSFAGP